MKNLLLLLAVCCTAMPLRASSPRQESSAAIRVVPVTVEDLVEMMEAQNTFIKKYDLSGLDDTTSVMWVKLDEYFGRDSVVNKLEHNLGPVHEEYSWGEASTIREIVISCWQKSDSTAMLSMNAVGRAAIALPVKLRKVAPDYEKYPDYGFRPFALQDTENREWTPLALYGSWWYDEGVSARSTAPIYRFCGSNELDPGMEDEMFDQIPHYLIVSIQLRKP